MKLKSIKYCLFLCGILLFSCKKSAEYNAKYDYPSQLIVQGSTSVTAGAGGFTSKYTTYYLGSAVTLAWSTSSPADVDLTPTPDNQTEITVKFKPSAAGKTITVTVKSSNGITGSKDVTVN